MSRPMKAIPISAGEKIAKEYGYDQVVIYARRVGAAPDPHGEHLTTYGVNKTHCDVAAQMGDTLKRFMGWRTEKEQWIEREAMNRHADTDATSRLWSELSEEQREHFRAEARADWDAD